MTIRIHLPARPDYKECYWCMKRRAILQVQEPSLGIFPTEVTLMCETCFRIRKQTFPFELLKYEMIKNNE